MQTLSERLNATREGQKAWHQERMIFEVTERLCELLTEKEISRTQFAKLMGTTKGYVSQLLDGESNMTLRTVSDAFLALGRAGHVVDRDLSIQYDKPCFMRLYKSPEWADDQSQGPEPEWRYKK